MILNCYALAVILEKDFFLGSGVPTSASSATIRDLALSVVST
jgi:hypothetical protein